MQPLPSRSAIAACAGGALGFAVAIVARSQAAAVLAGALLTGVACAFALTLPLAARLRRERLEFVWWHAAADSALSGGAVVAGAPFELRCRIRNRSARSVQLAWLAPVAPELLVEREPGPTDVWLAPSARTEFAFRYTAKACGRVVLQGLAGTTPGPCGLFLAPLYFPSPLVVEVLPRAALRSAALAWRVAGAPSAQAPQHGFAPLRRPGGGSDLRELREHRPGDPFKSIAWKASARAGKLIVREVEREVQETLYVVLDAGASMRGGLPGERMLDRGIEFAALATREALEHGDRVGLVITDARILSHVAPRDGLAHAARIHAALLAATAVVDADLTEPDDDAVAAMVDRYLRHQGSAHARLAQRADAEELAMVAVRLLPAGTRHADIVASDAAHRVLRAFCFHRGIPLAHRAEVPPLARAGGLADALREATGAARARRTMLVVTDGAAMRPIDVLDPTLAMLRSRGHAVAFVFAAPVASGEVRTPRLDDHRRFHELRRHLAGRGFPLVSGAPEEALAVLLRRARDAARAA